MPDVIFPFRRIRNEHIPFLATMFHAVGLNAMAANEIHRDCFEKSTAESKLAILFSLLQKRNRQGRELVLHTLRQAGS